MFLLMGTLERINMEAKDLLFRQPIFENGQFKEWHYWGAGIEQGGEIANVGWLTYKMGVTDPKQSLQYIGIDDELGQKIFHGDILKITDYPYLPYSQDKDESSPYYKDEVVIYQSPMYLLGGWLNFDFACKYEIIGHIYEPQHEKYYQKMISLL